MTENNMLLKEILQKLTTQEIDTPVINPAKTVPCPADDEEDLKAICNLNYLVSSTTHSFSNLQSNHCHISN